MRKTNCKTKKDIWNCKIVDNDNITLKDTNYKTITEIAEALGLSYNQVSDYRQGGRCKKKGSKFLYQPSIIISRINPTQKEIYDKKRLDKAHLILENQKN